MKYIILLLVFNIIGVASFAQSKASDKDKAKALKKAESESTYVAEHMKLDEGDKTFLFNTFNTRFLYTATYAGGDKGADAEYKKGVYKKASQWTNEELNKRFSKSETKQILNLLKTKRDHDKKNKNN